ncbi:MAG TPA: hypothetical protein VFA75_19205 [Nevskia sp.]|nr:hypothetical protein [Nevskia sp.]
MEDLQFLETVRDWIEHPDRPATDAQLRALEELRREVLLRIENLHRIRENQPPLPRA